MVKSKLFGIGEVISREVVGDRTCLTVRFESGKEMRLVIPESFETGAVEAMGALKDEVDRAIVAKKASVGATRIPAMPAATATPKKRGKKHPVKAIPASPLAAGYEDYLIKAGYRVETDKGDPSTVFAYVNAVEVVLTEEGISWDTLKANISTIVPKYDVGGAMELIGAKSNKTVINALKRFEEFVNP